ncbi:hypothetical protein [Actinomadura rudentiformis]|uniref:PH domain-containing protein n=1 Tax=Actinomadura rudentiformis TaxID=359158 RepID=A0A6H9YBI4_9ACTN|nr:hypothetical protein [Actinomadura rudentiformis]KAB2341313.1 hypothetical protein F8566_42105 [Actinomadura rudentiformis]
MGRTSGEPVLRLHPERRSPLIAIPALAAGPVLLLAGILDPSVTALIVGFGATAFAARSLVILNCGVTEAWPDGLTNRLAGRQAEVAWERVVRFVVVPTLFGRLVQAEERDGARISLAAPRSGLIMRSPGFGDQLNELTRMPGGGREPVPVQAPEPAQAVVAHLVQSALALGFMGALAMALLD